MGDRRRGCIRDAPLRRRPPPLEQGRARRARAAGGVVPARARVAGGLGPDAGRDPGRCRRGRPAGRGRWQARGVMLSAAGSLAWLRDTVAPAAAYDVLLAEAGRWEPGAEGL